LGDDSTSIDVICGPTAAGKSAVVGWLAERHAIAVISADSRQIYRGFDVGTAKPSAAERAAAPHYGIDIVEPDTRYSASAWADRALEWIAESRAEGRMPVVIGGTGFYIRALVEPLFVEPPLDPERRRALAVELDALSTPDLRQRCEELDPARATLGRTQLLRAIEVATLTGTRLSDLHKDAARAGGLTARYLLLDPGAALAQRIEQRAAQMFEKGWLDETRRLMQRVPADAPAWNATGYREIRRLAAGECTVEEALNSVVISTRQYAKRQRTWFRHQLPTEAVLTANPDDPRFNDTLERWWTNREGKEAA
jgi:tRNA dimethylallyltransferase